MQNPILAPITIAAFRSESRSGMWCKHGLPVPSMVLQMNTYSMCM